MQGWRAAVAAVLMGAAAAASAAPGAARVIADADAPGWAVVASDQVRAALRRDGDGALCLDYDFGRVSGYAVMRREQRIDWPRAFDVVARLKASGPRNDVQIKFTDAAAENVWWINRPNAELPPSLTDLRIAQRHVGFAWGPTGDRALRRTEAVELVVAAGRGGGAGSLCLQRLTLRERAPDPATWPEPVRRAGTRTLDVDLLHERELNGVALRWPAGAERLDYDVAVGDADRRRWTTIQEVRGSDGGLDVVYAPDLSARHLRVTLRGGHAPAMPVLEPRDAQRWPDFNAVLAELAAELPPGQMPRAYAGQQNYWTVVGVDGGGARSALFSEDGALEIGRGGFSLEPSVQVDQGTPLTWRDVRREPTLREGYLPMPAVLWSHEQLQLDIEAAADGPAAAPSALVRYRLHNPDRIAHRYELLLAVRPWQVNPPQQFLNTPGGARELRTLAWDGRRLVVDDRDTVRPLTQPAAVTALPFDGGLSLAALRRAPPLERLIDPQSHASALLRFPVTLEPGARHEIVVEAPLAPDRPDGAVAGAGDAAARLDRIAAGWRDRLNRVAVTLPGADRALADALRSALAQMLVARDGAMLKPGTRSYARTWIRDGAMMVAALVRLGEADAAREFVDAFAPQVFDSGKVPCCVDARGADPVAENDSHGEYLYAVAEVWRHGGDRAFLERHWPVVQRVVAYQDGLRRGERSERNRAPGREHLYGLMPPSISHEGYSDKPAYSNWDNFWALRGYKDAVAIARALGREDEATRWAAARDEFESDLAASALATARHHRIDYIAGAADRGDFDATATTVALNPAQATLPPALLAATFERYWQDVQQRAEALREWKDYTPYEWRSVGAFARLGQPERAHALLRFLFADRRPPAWNQWAEVVYREARRPGFIGDMPHAWVASDFIRSMLDLLAYDDEREGSVVVGPGWSRAWRDGGVAVQGLGTAFGPVGYRLEPTPQGWRFNLTQPTTAPGGVRLVWPAEWPLPAASIDGQPAAWDGRTLRLPARPVVVDLPNAPN